MTINPHIMNLVAIERIADLRRDAARHPEATAEPRKARRVKRTPEPRHWAAVAPIDTR
ncbi:MAG: hypothetical protein WB557_32460 [Solirubrobacteraceae bacterium]